MRRTLLEARKQAGLTQEQIASAVGIDRTYYVHIEKGKRNPSLGVAAKIAALLERSVEEIFLPYGVAK